MAYEYIKETDPQEVESSKHIPPLLKRASHTGEILESFRTPEPGSPLAADDARSPHYPVSDYAHMQLQVAVGRIDWLEMIIRESDNSIDLIASPYGAYALIRNAMDAAAVALWLLEPQSSTGRLKRRLLLAVDEVRLSAAFRQGMDKPGVAAWKASYRARLKEVAEEAGLKEWNPLKTELHTMTQILKDLERWHDDAEKGLPWLSVWQLASGHAHAKGWAQLASHQIEEIPGTRTETGAGFRVTISYTVFAFLLLETVRLIEMAGARYWRLARP